MQAHGFSPAPEADRVTLIRRLSLDLIGLPPTPAEVDEFVSDTNPDAFQKLIERLLSSPHYGERWGRHWLDAARYADTNGYEKDLPRSIWPYRDWVIQAFNRDLPFNEFTIEQIAGDLIPNATLDQRVATGFLRNSMLNEEGGVDPEQFRVEAVADRVDAVGKAFLGLTLNCARCHDHKYDPISQREYYEFFAFLNNDDEPAVEVPNAKQRQHRAQILKEIAAIEDSLTEKTPEVAERMARWEERIQSKGGHWTVLEPASFFGAVGTKFTKLKDGSLLATASNPPVSGYTISAETTLTNITGFRLEVLTDPNLPAYGPGRGANGNFVLTEFSVEASPKNNTNEPAAKLELQHATADFAQAEFPVSAAIDGMLTNKNGWAVDGGPLRRNQDRKAVFQTKGPVGFKGGTALTFHLEQLFGKEHCIGRLRLSVTTDAAPEADPLSVEVRKVLAIPSRERTADQQRRLFSVFRTTDSACAEANQKIDQLLKSWPEAPTTLVLAERSEPRETHILKRGEFQKPGELVGPGVPAVLNPIPAGRSTNRMTLAKWLVDPKNPLLARVTVNRVWQEYFGRGLVATSEDFGTQGAAPSHPELLDWLATEFVRQGWSLKAIHRLIAESATYRQDSKVTQEKFSQDPLNRWLARGPRFRVEAEAIRDIALSASGLLSEKVGGPSVYPPIPDGVLTLGYGAPMPWPTSKGPDRYRRAMYTFWKRSVPYPSLLVFDAPTADSACVRRAPSNTPLQALTTLNDTVFHEAAQAMGLRILKEGGESDLDRAIYAFRLCVARKPDAAELQEVLSLLQEQRRYFERRTTAAIRVASPDPANPPDEVNLHETAAWTMVSRVLLNLDETITKE